MSVYFQYTPQILSFVFTFLVGASCVFTREKSKHRLKIKLKNTELWNQETGDADTM